MTNSFFTGFLVSAGLLIAIGAQNTFVIRQGVSRQYVFTVSATCFICDFILMCIGVLGIGKVINDSPILMKLLALAGILFLFWYGVRSILSAIKGESFLTVGKVISDKSYVKVIMTTISFSLLNPNVWIDAVAIVGGVSSTINNSLKVNYLAGALTASFLWFFSIGYLASGLVKIFKTPRFWRLIDFAIGLYMLYMAWGLLPHLTR